MSQTNSIQNWTLKKNYKSQTTDILELQKENQVKVRKFLKIHFSNSFVKMVSKDMFRQDLKEIIQKMVSLMFDLRIELPLMEHFCAETNLEIRLACCSVRLLTHFAF